MAKKTTTKAKAGTEKVELLKKVKGRGEAIGAVIELPTDEVEILVKFKRVKRVGTKTVETR